MDVRRLIALVHRALKTNGTHVDPITHDDGGGAFNADLVAVATTMEAFAEMTSVPLPRRTAVPSDLLAILGPGPLEIATDLLLHSSGLDETAPVYWVCLERQISMYGPDGYAGGSVLSMTLSTMDIPEGRVPRAERWGSARSGVPPREPYNRWVGDQSEWMAAVSGSRSTRVLEEREPVSLRVVQSWM